MATCAKCHKIIGAAGVECTINPVKCPVCGGTVYSHRSTDYVTQKCGGCGYESAEYLRSDKWEHPPGAPRNAESQRKQQ